MYLAVGLACQAGGTLSTFAMLNGLIADTIMFLYYASPLWAYAVA